GFIQISSGEPNLRTEMRNIGTITQGDAHFDTESGGKLRILAGGLYDTVNTNSDFGFRQINGGAGVSVESGGTLKHSSAARFLTNTTGNPAFNVDGGTLQVTAGTLGINGTSLWKNANLNVGTGAALNLLTSSNVTIEGT